MDAITLRQGRYLLYLDILGFTQLVLNGRADEVYKTVDETIRACEQWEHLSFRVISFSDTIVLYQVPVGWGSSAFCDGYAIAGMTWSALLAKGIPTRGAIAFGEFSVHDDSSHRHQIYFGKALIEAYEAERREWLGIAVCPSAWQAVEFAEPGTIDVLARERRWIKEQGDMLLLNPFIKLEGWYPSDLIGEIDGPYETWDAPFFPNDLRAFRYLLDKVRDIDQQVGMDDRVAKKYRNTVDFLHRVISDDCWEWADRISSTLRV